MVKYSKEKWMIMITGIEKICILILIGSLCLIVPGNAASLSIINPGNTVFIGEEGLDITAALEGDTQIGWWASGAEITGRSPNSRITVSNPTGFAISKYEFGSSIGSWYHLDPAGQANGTAFTVTDPYLDIKVEDTTVNVDVTDKWVPTDDEIRFRIDTNLATISERGAGAPPVSIRVQPPEGGQYTALINKAGTTTSIENILVPSTPYYTDPIWDTGKRATYPTGTYTIWAECNVNGMNDNYDVTGKTISREISLLNQDRNPLISANVPTTNPTIQMTIPPTTKSTTALTSTPTTQKTTDQTLTTITASTTLPATAAIPSTPVPPPTTKAAGGFEAALAGAAIIMGLVLSLKKN